jgi:GntP family gluconate:H+ symporter
VESLCTALSLRTGVSLAQPPALAGFLFALFALALARGRSSEEVRVSMTDSLKAVASILMIIGAGGAFNDVLEASGISDAVSAAATSVHMPLLLLGWLLALALSTTTGSATVGIVAATGILAPLVTEAGSWHTSLIVVAIGAGSLGLNYVNHAGFWLVKESFGMSLGQAVKTQTAV